MRDFYSLFLSFINVKCLHYILDSTTAGNDWLSVCLIGQRDYLTKWILPWLLHLV